MDGRPCASAHDRTRLTGRLVRRLDHAGRATPLRSEKAARPSTRRPPDRVGQVMQVT